jgi:phosphatidylserine/phosphatidylglycerophosphate/cardiolipin synthase-like enzyme
MDTPAVFTPYDFLEDFLDEAKKAKHSIYLQSMNFEAGGVLGKIEKVLIEALNRGVRVNINHDWVAKVFVQGDLPLLPSPSSKRRHVGEKLHRESQELEANLKAHGATIITTNTPNPFTKLLPMVGRNHIKMYIVDEKIAWMGGVNLFDDAFNNIDIMIRFEDEKIVNRLTKQFFMVNSLQSPVDYSLRLTDTERLFVDSGKKGSSIIYQEALEQVDRAKESIVFMSQFVPDGQLLRHLLQATKRGVKVDVMISYPQSVLFRTYPTKLTYLYFKHAIRKNPYITVTHKSKNVHAKIIIVDGIKALVGSHNYTYSGVLFGTEEIMIETTNEALVEDIGKFVVENK